MTVFSICGIDCNLCKYKEENGCKGCRVNEGEIFWGKCDIYTCCITKKILHCGLCADFPCSMLREWASDENPERIDNLKKLVN